MMKRKICKGQFWTEKIRKRTILNRKDLKNNNSEKESSEKGQFRKRTILKRTRTVNQVQATRSSQPNQVWSTRSGQPGPVNQVQSTRSGQPGPVRIPSWGVCVCVCVCFRAILVYTWLCSVANNWIWVCFWGHRKTKTSTRRRCRRICICSKYIKPIMDVQRSADNLAFSCFFRLFPGSRRKPLEIL